MERVYQYLKKSPMFFVATSDEDRVRVRPFGAVSLFEGRLYLVTNNQKEVYRQIKARPWIEVAACHGDGTWMRLEATAEEDLRREARVRMMEENEEGLSPLYHVDDQLMTVFCLKDCTASFCSFTQEAEVVKF